MTKRAVAVASSGGSGATGTDPAAEERGLHLRRMQQRLHAGLRAAQRYGIDYTPTIREAISGRILRSRGRRESLQQNGREIWTVPYGGRRLTLAWDPQTLEICSFLPSDWWKGPPGGENRKRRRARRLGLVIPDDGAE